MTGSSASVSGKRAALEPSPALTFIKLIMIKGGWGGSSQIRSSALYATSLSKVCALTEKSTHPTDVSSFLFFFSFAGLRRILEGANLMMRETSIIIHSARASL